MNESFAVKSLLDETKRALDQSIGAFNIIQKQVTEVEGEVQLLSDEVVTNEKAIQLLQKYAESQQNMLSARIEGTVTSGLRAVFQDNNLEFKLTYSETKTGAKKKTPEVRMSVLYTGATGEPVSGNLQNSFGGGLSVVAAVLLNIIVVLYMEPRVRPILFLDEPLKDLSPAYDGQDSIAAGYRERMGDFLRSLVDNTDLQVILVSHEPEYARVADINHKLLGGIGKITKVKTEVNASSEDDELSELE